MEEYWDIGYLHPNGVWVADGGTLLPEVVGWMYFSTLDGSKPLT